MLFMMLPSAIRLFLILILAIISTLAGAEETPRLPTVIVTATRVARTADQNLAPMTIVEQDEITHALTIPEILRNVSGIDINSSGGFGKITNLSLRGTNSNHVLLLVDGIPLGSATAGTPAWEYVPLTQAQRIEVVRGPRSSLYGSAAIGGIVQMFTPRGAGPLHAEISAQAGSFDTYNVNANVAGATDNSHYYLGGGHLSTAGINAGNPWSPKEFDNDGYRNSSFSLRLGHRFGNAEIEGHLLRSEGHSASDGAFTSEDFLQTVAGIDLTLSPANPWQMRLSVGESRDERDDFGIAVSRFHTRRLYTSWQNDVVLTNDQVLTVGIDRQNDHVDSTENFTVNSQTNTGIFLQHQATFGNHELLAGVRYDDNEEFAGHTTGNLAYGIHLTPTLRFTAAWGSAFKAPTFNDLYYYYPFDGYYEYQPNPHLHPETAQTYEMGFIGTNPWGNWELRAFRTDIDDLITNTYLSPTLGSMINLNRARIEGVETKIVRQFNNWALSASLDLLDPRDRDTDKVLPRRARHTARINLMHQDGPLHSALTILNQGGRYDNAENTTPLSGYTLVDFQLNYRLNRAWILDGQINNLFDKDYQTVAGYNAPGRMVMVGVRYTSK